MSRRPFLLWGLALLTLLLGGSILVDALPWLRGPQPESAVWHWGYELRPFSRWWLAILAGSGLLLTNGWWLKKGAGPGYKRLAISSLILFTILLQVGLVYADREQWWAELLDRTLAVQTNGYFWTAAQVPDGELNQLLAQYPAALPAFESDHVRTHPPGLLLLNWGTTQLLERFPATSELLARQVRPERCLDLWLLNQPAPVVAAAAVWALLPLLLAAVAVWPAYDLTQQLNSSGDERAAWLAAGLTAVLPALLLMSPLADQLYPVLILTICLTWLLGQQRDSRPLLFLSGLLLSLATFLSLGNGVLALVLLSWWGWEVHRQGRWKEPRIWLKQMVTFGLGAALLWLFYWLIWQVPSWAIIKVNLAEHEAATVSQRSFSRWLPYNLLDLFLFAGPWVTLGFLLAAFNPTARQKSRSLPGLALGVGVMLLFLSLSGSTRGEVGRIWLFFMPLLAIGAAIYWAAVLNKRGQLLAVLGLHLLWALILGLAWEPIEALIVVPQKPEWPAPPAQMMSVEVGFGEHIQLAGYTLNQEEEALQLTLVWEADGASQRPLTVFNHLLNATGELVSQQDNWPVNGQWPPTCWREGDQIVDQYTLPLPPDLPPGPYRLFTGFYDATTLDRLPTATGEDSLLLTTLTLENEP